MKKIAFISLLFLCPIFSNEAAILNGFSQKKMILEKKIQTTKALLERTDCVKTYKKLERQLIKLQKEYKTVQKKHSETQWLIDEVQQIDPELCKKVASITNAEGTLTQVYVRFVNGNSKEFKYFTDGYFKANAYTSVRQASNNKHVCESLHGTNSITVTVGKGCDVLFALAHEFAHVIYIVPNLKEYLKFYENHYRSPIGQKYRHGHSPYDPGHEIINQIEKSFNTKYKSYLKGQKNLASDPVLVSEKN